MYLQLIFILLYKYLLKCPYTFLNDLFITLIFELIDLLTSDLLSFSAFCASVFPGTDVHVVYVYDDDLFVGSSSMYASL